MSEQPVGLVFHNMFGMVGCACGRMFTGSGNSASEAFKAHEGACPAAQARKAKLDEQRAEADRQRVIKRQIDERLGQ